MPDISPTALEKAELLRSAMEDELNRADTPYLTAQSSSKRDNEMATSWGSLFTPDGSSVGDLLKWHSPILDEGLWAVTARAHRDAPTDKWHVEVRLHEHSVREKLEQLRKKLDKEVEKEFRRFAEGKQWYRVALSYYPRTGPAELIVDTGGTAVEKYPLTEKLNEMLQRAIGLYKDDGLELLTAKWALKKKLAFSEYFG
jgi:hypothetical protein